MKLHRIAYTLLESETRQRINTNSSDYILTGKYEHQLGLIIEQASQETLGLSKDSLEPSKYGYRTRVWLKLQKKIDEPNKK